MSVVTGGKADIAPSKRRNPVEACSPPLSVPVIERSTRRKTFGIIMIAGASGQAIHLCARGTACWSRTACRFEGPVHADFQKSHIVESRQHADRRSAGFTDFAHPTTGAAHAPGFSRQNHRW